MRISDTGEFPFIERISSAFKDLVPENVMGIGDDCAVFYYGDTAEIITTDMLVENSHFYADAISPFELGYKALAVNLSDIAAMGGVPEAVFLSAGIHSSTSMEWLDEFIRGFRELSVMEKVPLCGGDTVKSDRIVINVTVKGKCSVRNLHFRSMAEDGDVIFCTGKLGDSAAGFRLLRSEKDLCERDRFLIKRHHQPSPETAAGKWLGEQSGVRAMMDISDGLVSDLSHILRASGKGAVIDMGKIPLSQELEQASAEYGWDPVETALFGGEDYCLLLTADNEAAERISVDFSSCFGRPLYAVGRITSGSGLVFMKDGKIISPLGNTFSHF